MYLSSSSILALAACLLLQQPPQDSIALRIDSTKVEAVRNASHIKGSSADKIEWDLQQMELLPKILGSADPVRYASLLPGVQTSSELDGGVHILGSEGSQNSISIDGVPVFTPYHMFGLFSAFNSSHFPKMEFSTVSADDQRLGGELKMKMPDRLVEGLEADLETGLISSSATLRLQTGKRSSLYVSARGSYINLLYGKLLVFDGDPMRYGFRDGNITWVCRPTERDKIWLNAYAGGDTGSIQENALCSDIDLQWGNALASAKWQHDFGASSLDQTLYYSGYGFDGGIDTENLKFRLPSSLGSIGYRGKWTSGRLKASLDAMWYRCSPQTPNVDGGYVTQAPEELQKALEIIPGASLRIEAGPDVTIDAALQTPLYLNPERELSAYLSPVLDAFWNLYRLGKVGIHYSYKRQNLFRTGFSDMGMPMEFWFLAGKHSSPQSAHTLSLSYDKEFGGGAFALSAQAYLKKLQNQIEYSGSLYDFMNSSYELDNVLVKGDGRNFGANLMFSKLSGNLTGWISFSWSRALRHFDSISSGKEFPARHERILELDAIANWKKGIWDFGAIFIAASGTPYTPIESFWLASGQIVANFGEYNSAVLEPYLRLDLCANCNFIHTRRGEGGINLSIYNAFGNPNYLYYRHHKETDGILYYQKMASPLRFLPSVSIYYKFR